MFGSLERPQRNSRDPTRIRVSSQCLHTETYRGPGGQGTGTESVRGPHGRGSHEWTSSFARTASRAYSRIDTVTVLITSHLDRNDVSNFYLPSDYDFSFVRTSRVQVCSLTPVHVRRRRRTGGGRGGCKGYCVVSSRHQ